MSETFRMIPLAELRESPTNPRMHFDPSKLAELAASIREKGVIQPLMARPQNGHYEIVAGARRYRAGQMAGLAELPCVIRDLDDGQVLEIQVIENSQREDVHPLEETEGFRRLLAKPGYDVATLAEKIGKSESYIHKRLKLAELIEPARQAFFEDRIQFGHALALARLSREQQTEVWEEEFHSDEWDPENSGNVYQTVFRAPTLKELERYLHENVYLDLSAAAWKKDDAELVPAAGPCTACPKRTGANGLLFDDIPKGDHCLDASCYQAKREAHIARIESERRQAGESLLRVATEWMDAREKKERKCLIPSEYCLVGDKKRCKATERAIVVAGRHSVGHLVDICRDAKCKLHGGYGYYGGATEKTFAETWKEKRKQLEQRIELETRQEVWRQLLIHGPGAFGRAELEQVTGHVLERAHHDRVVAVAKLLGVAPVERQREWGPSKDHRAALLEYAKQEGDEGLCRFLFAMVFAGAVETQAFDGAVGELYSEARRRSIDVDWIRQDLEGPRIEKFEKQRAAAEKKREEERRAGKAAKRKPRGKKKAGQGESS